MKCAACRYDLTALGVGVAIRCPECGRKWEWEELKSITVRPRRWLVMWWAAWPGVVQGVASTMALSVLWELTDVSALGLMAGATVGVFMAGVGLLTPLVTWDILRKVEGYPKWERRVMCWAGLGINVVMAGMTFWAVAAGVEVMANAG